MKDSYENVVPYLKPDIKESEKNKMIEVEFDNILEQEEIVSDNFDRVLDLENLSLYELEELAKEYKVQKRITEYRKVCRLIKKNADVVANKQYHKKKVLLKGIDEYDKY